MSVTLNGTTIPKENILAISIETSNDVQLPKWLDEPESLIAEFNNKQGTNIRYIIRATHAQKWVIDTLLRNHSLFNLTDTLYGINNDVYLITEDAQLSFARYGFPWEITLNLISDL